MGQMHDLESSGNTHRRGEPNLAWLAQPVNRVQRQGVNLPLGKGVRMGGHPHLHPQVPVLKSAG